MCFKRVNIVKEILVVIVMLVLYSCSEKRVYYITDKKVNNYKTEEIHKICNEFVSDSSKKVFTIKQIDTRCKKRFYLVRMVPNGEFLINYNKTENPIVVYKDFGSIIKPENFKFLHKIVSYRDIDKRRKILKNYKKKIIHHHNHNCRDHYNLCRFEKTKINTPENINLKHDFDHHKSTISDLIWMWNHATVIGREEKLNQKYRKEFDKQLHKTFSTFYREEYDDRFRYYFNFKSFDHILDKYNIGLTNKMQLVNKTTQTYTKREEPSEFSEDILSTGKPFLVYGYYKPKSKLCLKNHESFSFFIDGIKNFSGNSDYIRCNGLWIQSNTFNQIIKNSGDAVLAEIH